MIDLMRLILGRKGFEVKGAAGGVEGLRMIRQEMPDLVLLDLDMEPVDGIEVMKAWLDPSVTRWRRLTRSPDLGSSSPRSARTRPW